MKSSVFYSRLYDYMSTNFFFSIYYDKLYRKEYLPSRIRYNQFFFYGGLLVLGSVYLSNKNNGMLCPTESKVRSGDDLGNRRYYTSERTFVNFLKRSMNKSETATQANKETFFL